MYVIQFLNTSFSYDRRRKHTYFMGFWRGDIREYGSKAEAMVFATRADANEFLRNRLGDRADHRVVKA